MLSKKSAVLCLIIACLLIVTSFTGCGGGGSNSSGNNTGGSSDSSGSGGSGGSKEVYTLRFATYNPGEAAQSKAKTKFMEDIERLTDGRVKFNFFPGSMLVTPDKMFDGVVEGIADLGYAHLAYTFGRFPVTEVLDLPIGFPNGWVSNHVAVDFFNEFKPKEWDDVHMITLNTSNLNVIITVDKPIKHPDNLKGLTLRGGGYIAQLVESMGAASRSLPAPDTYDYLAKNIIDGALFPYETMQTYSYGDVVNNITEVWQASNVFTFYIVMNKKTWNSLPADIQDIINKYVEEQFREDLATMWNNIGLGGKQYAVDQGMEIYVVPDSELPIWREKAEKVIGDYKARMISSGYTEAEINGWLKFIEERTAYWLEKQIELGIKSETGPPEVYQIY